jgi:hypothetical protein
VIVPTLARSGIGTQTALDHRRRRRGAADAPLSFTDHWNRPDVRGLLYAVHGHSCAYCGGFLPRNDRGDIDHFRPKGKVHEDPLHGGYWWLAYAIGNYLLSCSLCNSACKGTRFPLAAGTRRIAFAERRRLAQEARLLLDPAVDPIDDWVEVGWRDPLCPVRPRPGLAPREREQVEHTLALFRINRDPRLVGERMGVRDAVVKALGENRDGDARERAVRYRFQSRVAREILADQRPSLLPTPREEQKWLLRELTQELLIALKTLEGFPGDPFVKRGIEELLWALAVLWRDPPAGDPAEVEAFLVGEVLDGAVRLKARDLGSTQECGSSRPAPPPLR